MRKYSILSILPILVMTVAVLAPLPTSASVACPTGLICTPIVANCPAGYICTPNASSNTSNTASLISVLSALTSASTVKATANSAINCPPEVVSCANVSSTRQNDTQVHVVSTTPLLSSYANYATLPYTNTASSRDGCSIELSFENANLISNILQSSQTQKASIVNSSTLHVKDIAYKTDAVMGGKKDYGKDPKAKFLFDICLGSGYTSNIPAGVDANRIISLNTPSTQWIVLDNPEYAVAVAAAATSSTNYSISVVYGHFATEAAQYHYTSIYNATGTQAVTITVWKFADGQTLTAAQAIAQLSVLGYRPATLDELYAAKSQIGPGIVGLGTSLNGNGYPTSYGNGAAGMGMAPGPFRTESTKFAAVHK